MTIQLIIVVLSHCNIPIKLLKGPIVYLSYSTVSFETFLLYLLWNHNNNNPVTCLLYRSFNFAVMFFKYSPTNSNWITIVLLSLGLIWCQATLIELPKRLVAVNTSQEKQEQIPVQSEWLFQP